MESLTASFSQVDEVQPSVVLGGVVEKKKKKNKGNKVILIMLFELSRLNIAKTYKIL